MLAAAIFKIQGGKCQFDSTHDSDLVWDWDWDFAIHRHEFLYRGPVHQSLPHSGVASTEWRSDKVGAATESSCFRVFTELEMELLLVYALTAALLHVRPVTLRMQSSPGIGGWAAELRHSTATCWDPFRGRCLLLSDPGHSTSQIMNCRVSAPGSAEAVWQQPAHAQHENMGRKARALQKDCKKRQTRRFETGQWLS